MRTDIAINGRFLSRPVTGVERYGREILLAWDKLARSGQAPIPTVYVPSGSMTDLKFDVIKIKPIGRLKGHLWEQIDLARETRKSTLVSFANSGPVFHKKQFVVIHDAAPFRHPNAYSRMYRTLHKFLGTILSRIN